MAFLCSGDEQSGEMLDGLAEGDYGEKRDRALFS
jgi:hypothetical protein